MKSTFVGLNVVVAESKKDNRFERRIKKIVVIYFNTDMIQTIIENDHYHFEDEATGKPVRITTIGLTTGDSYLIFGTPGDVINEIYKTEKAWALIEKQEEKAQLC